MSDSTTSANDLGLAPVAPDVPQMSVAEASSRKQDFFANKAKMDALWAGDANATQEWRNIVNAISAQPQAPTDPREEATDALQQAAGYTLRQEVLDEFKENRPVTPLERHFARAKFEELKNDPDWIARFNRGELEARKTWSLLCSVMSRPIRDPQPQ